MRISQFKKLVGSKIFTATFLKKDGTLRTMNARLGVKKHLRGGNLAYSPSKLGYVTVYDLASKGYRTINLNTLKEVKINGYKVVCNEA